MGEVFTDAKSLAFDNKCPDYLLLVIHAYSKYELAQPLSDKES